ncbi:hypothetical protein EI94DRAFT_1809882 [Lactarius quietus]|nr:hypothetical protein EI94DRAFT_1809882 [Lactarius quietus]
MSQVRTRALADPEPTGRTPSKASTTAHQPEAIASPSEFYKRYRTIRFSERNRREQVSQDVRAQLGQEVKLRLYDAFIPYLKELSVDLQVLFSSPPLFSVLADTVPQAGQKIVIGDKTSVAVADFNIACSPIADIKAIKNVTEIEGFRCACHIRDGAALVRYFAWLEEQLNQGVKLSESEGAD